MNASMSTIQPHADNAVVWHEEQLHLLDQRILPLQTEFIQLNTGEEVAHAIRDMVVRGAPAIGIAAAFGVVVGARNAWHEQGSDWERTLEQDLRKLAASRPTAVNLFWALKRMRAVINELDRDQDPTPKLLAEAKDIHREDIAANRCLGDLGAELIEESTKVITHCNAGALATGGYGTALGVIRSAFAAGKIEQVYADETRLTAWELQQDNIPVTLLVDGAAASLMTKGNIGWVIVGSDRIAANGDVANKIGTYGLAVAAKHHGVKVMVAAPTSTIDMSVTCGADIPIEQRDPKEVLSCNGTQIGTPGVEAWNPVFDVTPAELVDAIVTERGIVLRPNAKKLSNLMASQS